MASRRSSPAGWRTPPTTSRPRHRSRRVIKAAPYDDLVGESTNGSPRPSSDSPGHGLRVRPEGGRLADPAVSAPPASASESAASRGQQQQPDPAATTRRLGGLAVKLPAPRHRGRDGVRSGRPHRRASRISARCRPALQRRPPASRRWHRRPALSSGRAPRAARWAAGRCRPERPTKRSGGPARYPGETGPGASADVPGLAPRPPPAAGPRGPHQRQPTRRWRRHGQRQHRDDQHEHHAS
jgi:hypothetical protein